MTLEILFPELCSLFGDAMNPELLLRAVPELEAVRTSIKARPAFADSGADMVYLGSMTERSQELCAGALMPYREQLAEQIERGTVFLVTGNAAELFGHYIENDDGSRLDMLGLFDFSAKRRMMNRYNSLYLGKFSGIDIVGFVSRFSHIYNTASGESAGNTILETGEALFETIRGAGRAPGVVPEGLQRKNFMATSILGPLLVLNPLFLKYLMGLLGFPDRGIPFEKAAMDAYEERLREFRDPKTVETF